MNILIIRVSAIGDVIHTLPSLFYLKQILPHAKISWIVQKKASQLLIDQPLLKNVYVLPNNFLAPKHLKQTLQTIAHLRKTKWDAIIDFQGLEKTSFLYMFLSGKKFGFAKNHARSKLTAWFTHHQTIPEYTNIIQKNLSLTSTVISHLLPQNNSCPTLNEINKKSSLHISQQDKEMVNRWLNENNLKNFVLFSPNTTWSSKHWPLSHWKELLSTIKHPTVLLGKTFGGQAKELESYIIMEKLSVHIAPNFNLLQVAHLITCSKVLIAPDTGILHLGDFLGAQTIGFFGPTFAKRHGPFLYKKNIHHAIQIDCPHQYQKSHYGKSCMAKLTPEQLCQSISRIMST